MYSIWSWIPAFATRRVTIALENAATIDTGAGRRRHRRPVPGYGRIRADRGATGPDLEESAHRLETARAGWLPARQRRARPRHVVADHPRLQDLPRDRSGGGCFWRLARHPAGHRVRILRRGIRQRDDAYLRYPDRDPAAAVWDYDRRHVGHRVLDAGGGHRVSRHPYLRAAGPWINPVGLANGICDRRACAWIVGRVDHAPLHLPQPRWSDHGAVHVRDGGGDPDGRRAQLSWTRRETPPAGVGVHAGPGAHL